MSRREQTGRGGFGDYLLSHKRWWLLPIVAMLLLLAFLVTLTSSGPSPFAYTFF